MSGKAARLAVRTLRLLGQAQRLPKFPLILLLLILVIPAVFAEVIAPYGPLDSPQGIRGRLEPPVFAGGTWDHILGTDLTGRDMFTRIIYGSRVSIVIAGIGIAIAGTIGITLGIISGYYGGLIDAIIMRLVDISLSIPPVLLALTLATVLDPSFRTVIIVVGALLWSIYCRQVRGDTLSVRTQDYIARARVSGASDIRIMVKHILPNIINTVIVLATLQVGFVILLEAGLSFLGVGLSRPTPAWGLMVADGREVIIRAWWVALWPGLAIMLTVFGFNLLGDWLRDRLDPRLRQL
ncbi:MAG: ABC transporter permease [Chloroflexi bacterium]|nr:ABC transporter permease [Chloroflexota bacterium]